MTTETKGDPMSDKTDPRLDVATAWVPAEDWEDELRRCPATGAANVTVERAVDMLADLDVAAREAGYVPMLDTRDEALVARIEMALRGEGLSDKPAEFDSSIHSWRCEYPDRYGPCSCFTDLRDAILTALREES